MYIVLEIQKNADNTVGTLVNTYENKEHAESAYHQVLTYAAVSALPTHACVLMTEEGICVRSEYYSHVEQDPEQSEVPDEYSVE